MKIVRNYENDSVINNVVLDKNEQQIVDMIRLEMRKGNEEFLGVALLAQAIHRGFDSTYMVDGWRLMFQSPYFIPVLDEDGEETEYVEEDWQWDFWCASDTAILIAYAHLAGDTELFNSYPAEGWYTPQKTIQEMAENGFIFNACPMIVEGKYDRYDTELPTYVGSRYYRHIA